MDKLCEFIFLNYNKKTNKKLTFSIYPNYYTYMPNVCTEIKKDLLKMMKIKELILYPENANTTETLVSFKYKGRKCNIYELFGTINDYICVDMEPII